MSIFHRENSGWWFGLSAVCFINTFYTTRILTTIGIILIAKGLTDMLIQFMTNRGILR